MWSSGMALGWRFAALCVMAGTVACGQGCSTESDRTVAWGLGIGSTTTFGARIWLDGEAVYTEASATAQAHHVELERPYRAGEHVVEFEILAASASPSTYTAAWTVQVKPSGSLFTADGVPTALGVGQRLTIRVPL